LGIDDVGGGRLGDPIRVQGHADARAVWNGERAVTTPRSVGDLLLR
jgi:hypothetical protein